jgi:hypothetical protein
MKSTIRRTTFSLPELGTRPFPEKGQRILCGLTWFDENICGPIGCTAPLGKCDVHVFCEIRIKTPRGSGKSITKKSCFPIRQNFFGDCLFRILHTVGFALDSERTMYFILE